MNHELQPHRRKNGATHVLRFVASLFVTFTIVVGVGPLTALAATGLQEINPFASTALAKSSSAILEEFTYTGPNSGYAVGFQVIDQKYPRALILEDDHSSWSIVPLPSSLLSSGTGDTPESVLSDVVAVSSSNVWAVGSRCQNGCPGEVTQALILHFNGVKWNVVTNPAMTMVAPVTLKSVVFEGPNDGWTIGEICTSLCASQSGTVTRPFAEHWNGSVWKSANVNIAALPGEVQFTQVAATSPNNVWILGEQVTGCATSCTTAATAAIADRFFIDRFDGTTWTTQQLPIKMVGQSADPYYINTIDMVSPADVWAVGNYQALSSGAPFDLIMHDLNGTWSYMTTPGNSTSAGSLIGINVRADNDVYVAGYTEVSQSSAPTPIVSTWNGTSWSTIPLHYTASASTAFLPTNIKISSSGQFMIVMGKASSSNGAQLTSSVFISSGSVEYVAGAGFPWTSLWTGGIVIIVVGILAIYGRRTRGALRAKDVA